MNRCLARAWICAVAAIVSACAHHVRFISIPAGATVSVNGEAIGKTPILYTERSSWASSRVVRMQLSGYPTLGKAEPRKFCSDPGNIMLDILLVGLLFGRCMQDEYVYDFTRVQIPQRPASSPAKK